LHTPPGSTTSTALLLLLLLLLLPLLLRARPVLPGRCLCPHLARW
jgi:hypothetical protein